MEPLKKGIYDGSPKACQGKEVVAVLPGQRFEHMEQTLTTGSFECLKIFAAVGNAIEGVVFRIHPCGRSGKCCSPPGDCAIDHLGFGPVLIDPSAHKIDDPAKKRRPCASTCQGKKSSSGMATDEQAVTVHVSPRKQVLDDARHVCQRVLETRKSISRGIGVP